MGQQLGEYNHSLIYIWSNYVHIIYIYKVRGERVNGSHSLTTTALPYVGNWKPVMVGILCLACYCNCLIFCWCVALFMLMHCSAVV